MKKEMRKNGKAVLIISISIFAILLLTIVSAGWFDDLKAIITGKATSPVSLNISVGMPIIVRVYNNTLNFASGPNEAPAITSVIVNFTAYSPSGVGNLNHTSAMVNITGDTVRDQINCSIADSSGGNYANYTCNVTLWWWDGAGTWNISAYVLDNQTNSAMNATQNFYVSERTAFAMGPSALTWLAISPGATNQTSNNDPILLNNTGNDVIAATNISINSSNLRGETTPTEALWASNFSISWDTGATCSGAACVECGGNKMIRSAYTALTTANLTKGNYSLDNGNTGQERLYFCLRYAGTELSTQAYSTANNTEWNWIVRIL